MQKRRKTIANALELHVFALSPYRDGYAMREI